MIIRLGKTSCLMKPKSPPLIKCAHTQTDDSNSITDETTQTEQLHSDEQALHKPTTLTQREQSPQTRSNFIGRQLTPTKYLNTEETRTPWNKFTTVQSPYIKGKLSYKTEFKDG